MSGDTRVVKITDDVSVEIKGQTFYDWLNEVCETGDLLLVIKNSVGIGLHNKDKNTLYIATEEDFADERI